MEFNINAEKFIKSLDIVFDVATKNANKDYNIQNIDKRIQIKLL